jgi:hypothetical protein
MDDERENINMVVMDDMDRDGGFEEYVNGIIF